MMKILAVDTSGAGCSVCITDDLELCAEIDVRNKDTHSKHLMTLIDSLFNITRIKLNELDGFAVSHGPGSFTGLRIGLSTVQGLAAASGRPIIGISSLDSLAYGVSFHAYRICSVIDARKNEVFMANYFHSSGKLIKIDNERLCKPAEICNGINEKTIFIGSGVKLYHDVIKESLGNEAYFLHDDFNFIKAKNIAALSLCKFTDSDYPPELTPCYIRKSDAEINRCHS